MSITENIGKNVHFMSIKPLKNPDSESEKVYVSVTGKIIYENDYYYTIQTEKYRTSVNKSDLFTGKVVMKWLQ